MTNNLRPILRGILIAPETRTISEIFIERGIEAIYFALRGADPHFSGIFDVKDVGASQSLFIDDEGCLSPGRAVFALGSHQFAVYSETGYTPRDLHERLMGARLARDEARKRRANDFETSSQRINELQAQRDALLEHAKLTLSRDILTLRKMCRDGSDIADVLDALIADARAAIAKAEGK